MDILYPANKNVLNVTGLKDETGGFVNNAVITASLLDPTGAHVPGLDAIPLTYIAQSNGNYQGIVAASAFSPAPGTGYILQLVITVGGVLTDTINRPASVQERAA